MGKLLNFIKNKEPLKLVILDYTHKDIFLLNASYDYYSEHRDILKRPREKDKIPKDSFDDRLFNFIWTQKVSELLIILYLEDLKGQHPTIYELNRLLKRTSKQYSATIKIVKKLQNLGIVYTKPKPESKRKEKQVFINKDVVKLYGDDEFRKMMLDEWDSDAKEYIQLKLEDLKNQKEEFEEQIRMIKKRKRVKNGQRTSNL